MPATCSRASCTRHCTHHWFFVERTVIARCYFARRVLCTREHGRGREGERGGHRAAQCTRSKQGPQNPDCACLGLVMHVAKPKELGECCLYGVAVGMIRTAPECGRRQLQRLCGDGATTLWCLHYSPPPCCPALSAMRGRCDGSLNGMW